MTGTNSSDMTKNNQLNNLRNNDEMQHYYDSDEMDEDEMLEALIRSEMGDNWKKT